MRGSAPKELLVARVERIRALSGDLARELGRARVDTAIAQTMADTIKKDIDVVSALLAVHTPSRGH
jgi:hypothetical protein